MTKEELIASLTMLEGEDKATLISNIETTLTDSEFGLREKYNLKDRENMKIKRLMKENGYDKDSYADYEDYFKSKNKQPETVNDTETDNLAILELRTQLRTLTEANAAKDKEALKLTEKNKLNTITTYLKDKLGVKLTKDNAPFVIDSILGKETFEIKEDNSIMHRNGEEVISADQFVSSFLESNPGLVASTQKPGTGIPAMDIAGTGKQSSKYTLTDIRNMSKEEIKENLADIRKSA